MKKAISILLILVLFFTWFGYRMIGAFLDHSANAKFQAALDENKYECDKLMSFKVPTTSDGYYNNSNEYEKAIGQFEFNGIVYSIVKKRIFQDSIEILCIPNLTTMNGRMLANDLFKLINDLQQDGREKKGSSPVFKNLLVEYLTSDLSSIEST
ncbi:MAG: hypothetical protein C5B59_08375 [Bacteroidetes bacterium]|nr:MAG: hypothetical protein C5B59_08375 [Bacteroidota bacterium]